MQRRPGSSTVGSEPVARTFGVTSTWTAELTALDDLAEGNMTENDRVMRAADALVDRELLAPEGDARLIEVAVEGRGFRYAAAFWDKAGVRAYPADYDEARLRVAVMWAAVGAPLWWARTEAGRALKRFVSANNRLTTCS